MRFSLSGSKIILVSAEIIGKFAGDHPSDGVKVRPSNVASENLTNNESQLRNDARYDVSYY